LLSRMRSEAEARWAGLGRPHCQKERLGKGLGSMHAWSPLLCARLCLCRGWEREHLRARNPERKGAIAEADSKAHVTRKEEQQDEGGILCSSSEGFLNCKRLALGQRKALQVEGAACTRAWSWIVHAQEVTGQLRTIS